MEIQQSNNFVWLLQPSDCLHHFLLLTDLKIPVKVCMHPSANCNAIHTAELNRLKGDQITMLDAHYETQRQPLEKIQSDGANNC